MIKGQNKFIELFYYKCYYAYLQGDLKKAKMGYSFLKEEFRLNGLSNSLKPFQLSNLKKIKSSIETGHISKNMWLTDISHNRVKPLEEKIKQKELVKKIHDEGLYQLHSILNDSSLTLYNIEHPCGSYGRVDMVYMGKDTVYPIEVKCRQGGHDLIGQISKYSLHHKLHLHYKHYDYVQPVTLCHSYLAFALRELKTMGVKTLRYFFWGKGLRLEYV